MTTKNSESSNSLDSTQHRKDLFAFFAITFIISSIFSYGFLISTSIGRPSKYLGSILLCSLLVSFFTIGLKNILMLFEQKQFKPDIKIFLNKFSNNFLWCFLYLSGIGITFWLFANLFKFVFVIIDIDIHWFFTYLLSVGGALGYTVPFLKNIASLNKKQQAILLISFAVILASFLILPYKWRLLDGSYSSYTDFFDEFMDHKFRINFIPFFIRVIVLSGISSFIINSQKKTQ